MATKRPDIYQHGIWFLDQMLDKLEENNHKGGWRDTSTSRLLYLLAVEVAELAHAIITNKSREEIISEAADVANMASFIADKFKP